ncbi:DNA alkylation repair protein, partial [Alkalihalobacillus alcalophilus]
LSGNDKTNFINQKGEFMEPLKNLYTKEYLTPFTKQLKSIYPDFSEPSFYNFVFDSNWNALELKQRIRHISKAIDHTTPSYADAINYLMEIAPSCKGFGYLFFPDFVEVYGLNNWNLSVQALKAFTPYSSSEFAVRPYIEQRPEEMLEVMSKWALDENEHVRRLASEGARPRLPWAKPLHQLKADPTPILPILTVLKEDESLYVRKSVANHLNDISKDHPELVKKLAKEWYGHNERTDWILKHGCRTLLKKADPDILTLFGFHLSNDIEVTDFFVPNDVHIGEILPFSFNVNNHSEHPIKLRIEFAIDFVKKTGKSSRKLFQLTEKSFKPGKHKYTRKHSFKDLSTRKHYPGKHRLTLFVNGAEVGTHSFDVHREKETSQQIT